MSILPTTISPQTLVKLNQKTGDKVMQYRFIDNDCKGSIYKSVGDNQPMGEIARFSSHQTVKIKELFDDMSENEIQQWMKEYDEQLIEVNNNLIVKMVSEKRQQTIASDCLELVSEAGEKVAKLYSVYSTQSGTMKSKLESIRDHLDTAYAYLNNLF